MLWEIPAENSKINMLEMVPLSATSLALLPPADSTAYCFPGADKRKPLYPDTVSKYWVRACEKAGVKDFRLHDLRTAGGSHLATDHPYPIVSRVLGHKLRGGGAATVRYVQIEEDDSRGAAVETTRAGELGGCDYRRSACQGRERRSAESGSFRATRRLPRP